MSEVTIRAQGLGKRFRLYDANHPRTLRELLAGGWRRARSAGDLWALRDVDLNVGPGEMLGVVGHNGSGKSTLLRILGGVMRPDEGVVSTVGRISGLLELTMGMHPDLSGRENVMISGIIAGLTRREVQARFDSIVDFAELEDFIDSPLRTYSAGMKMRLGFSVAMHVDPGIMLIDEVLAVGDLAFQNKCLNRIQTFIQAGSAIVLITHDLANLQTLCTQALWLRDGQVAGYGRPDAVIDAFRNEMMVGTHHLTSDRSSDRRLPLELEQNRFGSMEVTIEAVRILNAAGQPVSRFEPGEALTVEADLNSPGEITTIHAVLIIGNPERYDIVNINSGDFGEPLKVSGKSGSTLRLSIESLPLAGGDYSVSIGVYRDDWSRTYDYHSHAYRLEVAHSKVLSGFIAPQHRWDARSR